MCHLNNLLKILLLLLYLATSIVGECVIKYPKNDLIKPHLAKKIGSRKIEYSNNNHYTTLHNNQEVVASCDIKFEKPKHYEYSREHNIRCHGSYLHINGKRYSKSIYMECASLRWNLYEILEPLFWCPLHMAPYVLARPNGGDLYVYRSLAGICYDAYNMSISTINYTIVPRDYKDMTPSTLVSFKWTPTLQINFVKDIFKIKSGKKYNNKKLQNWNKFSEYRFDSIIQNPNVHKDVFNEFSALLSFQWWSNLRLHNWRFYEEALAKHIEKENQAFDILAGISGVLMAPTKDSCDSNYTMRNVFDNNNKNIPLYVWNFINPNLVGADNPGIVIIGFNSPFKEFYVETDIIFCPDICETIDWLENARNTFRYGVMGIVFCCNVDDVRSSQQFKNFPPENFNGETPSSGSNIKTIPKTDTVTEADTVIQTDASTAKTKTKSKSKTKTTAKPTAKPGKKKGKKKT